jgi:hypothetical protein
VARGTVLATLAGGAGFLVKKANGQVVWQVDAARCINSRLGEVGVEACNLCTTECVVALSAVRAVNEHSKCGRCNICPAYFNITSAVNERAAEREAVPARRDRAQADRQGRPRGPGQQLLRVHHRRRKVRRLRQVRDAVQGTAGPGVDHAADSLRPMRELQPCAISRACPKDAGATAGRRGPATVGAQANGIA